jgi:hypothetical protein
MMDCCNGVLGGAISQGHVFLNTPNADRPEDIEGPDVVVLNKGITDLSKFSKKQTIRGGDRTASTYSTWFRRFGWRV